jgi:hypothetical protein
MLSVKKQLFKIGYPTCNSTIEDASMSIFKYKVVLFLFCQPLNYIPCTVETMMLLYHFWVHSLGWDHSTSPSWMNGEPGILMDSPRGKKKSFHKKCWLTSVITGFCITHTVLCTISLIFWNIIYLQIHGDIHK